MKWSIFKSTFIYIWSGGRIMVSKPMQVVHGDYNWSSLRFIFGEVDLSDVNEGMQ